MFLKIKLLLLARMGDIFITVGDLFAYGKVDTPKPRPKRRHLFQVLCRHFGRRHEDDYTVSCVRSSLAYGYENAVFQTNSNIFFILLKQSLKITHFFINRIT